MMHHLRLSGILGKLKGIVFGQFTGYKADRNHNTMEEMLRDIVAPYNYPIAFSAPIGHVDHNIPVIEGAHITLKVTANEQNHIIYWNN